jgi:sugar phosphate isomerase/epimerase
VSISGLGYYPNPLTADKKAGKVYIEHIKKLIDAAALLGLQNVNTFIGRDKDKTIEDNWSYFLKVWQPIIKHAEKKKVKIGIENCPMRFTKDEWPGGNNLAVSPSVWRKMFEAIPSEYFGLNYDPSHMVLQQMDYLAPIRNFASKMFHIHAKDLRIDHHILNEVGVFAHPNLWHTPKLPGLGDVNWGKFAATLNDIDYDGPVCVEVEDRAFEGSLEKRLQSLKQSHHHLRQFFVKG